MSGTNTITPSRSHLWIYGVGIGFILIGVGLVSSYNGLTAENEAVNQSYAQVQNVYQRQADLIPNMVATVKGYATHEKNTFVETAEARANAFKLADVGSLDPSKMANDPELQKKMIEAQAAAMASAHSLITAISESNPSLQASTQFTTLAKELEGSQNRITVERMRNQQAVQKYNTMVRVCPRCIIANLTGFTPKPYYAASDAAQTAPEVKF
jgi:LemA protein